MNTRIERGCRLLLVDDDSKFCLLIQNYLKNYGFEVMCVHEVNAAIDALVKGIWDAIVFDVMLPGADGYHFLRRVREKSDVPVLLMSELGDEETERIVGLEMGADDYLSKAFSPRELLARLKAVLRRGHQSDLKQSIVIGGLKINVLTRIVTLDDERIGLTPVEFEVLLSLALAKGRTRTREQLVEAIGERDFDAGDRSVDVHISALRKKLKDDLKNPRFIRTIRAVGYIMVDQ